MRFKAKSSGEIGLLLSFSEAKWLMAYAQNYYGEGDEPDCSLINRKELFEGIREALNLQPVEKPPNEDPVY